MIISVLMLCLTLSIDALFAGFSYGLSGTKIPSGSKLVICAFSVIYSAAALLIGNSVASLFSPLAGKIIGAAILMLLGAFLIVKPKIKSRKMAERSKKEDKRTVCKIILKSFGVTVEILKNNVEEADMDRSGVIDIREALLLGFALSVDSLGAGIGFALSGLFEIYIPFCVGLCQLLLLSMGLYLGLFCGRKQKKTTEKQTQITEIIPGVLLILLAGFRLL